MTDVLDDLEDLIVQATKERSHYYVAKCATRAVDEIKSLRASLGAVGVLSSGYIK